MITAKPKPKPKPVQPGLKKVKSLKVKARIRDRSVMGVPMVTNPVFAAASAGVDPGIRTIQHLIVLNSSNFLLMVSAWAQYFLVIGGMTIVQDDQYRQCADIYYSIATDLINAMLGKISVFDDVPLIYRELFEALMPKNNPTSSGVSNSFVFDEASLNFPIVEVNGFHVGGSLDTEYATTGLNTIESPYQISNVANANQQTQKFFSLMIAKGHKRWDKKDTIYIKDTSAYALNQPADSSVVVDFVGSVGTVSHESPIRSLWLAGLGLTTTPASRFAKCVKPFFAGPQSFMGHRLSTKQTGKEGANDHIRVQRVDVTELEIQSIGLMAGCGTQVGFSPTVLNTAGQLAVINAGDDIMYSVYVDNVINTATLLESPATFGYIDPLGTYVSQPYGTQYFPRDNVESGTSRFWQLTVENLRRLKVTCTMEPDLGTVWLYNVFQRSNPGLNFSFWGTTIFPTTFDLYTLTDATVGAVCVMNSAGTSGFGDYSAFTVPSYEIVTSPFAKWSTVTSEREQKAQMLTNLLRFVLPSPVGLRNYQSRTATSTAVVKGSKTPNPSRNWQKIIDIEEKRLREGSRYGKPLKNAPPTTNTQPYALGIMVASGNRRPNAADMSAFYSVVIPITSFNPAGGLSSSVQTAIAPSLCRLGVFTFNFSQNILLNYFDSLYLVGTRNTHPAGASEAPNELLQIFHNREDAGLGGAFGSIVNGLFGLAKKEKVRNAGRYIATAGDAILNAIPKTRRFNNM
jgi:hypothetical protein